MYAYLPIHVPINSQYRNHLKGSIRSLLIDTVSRHIEKKWITVAKFNSLMSKLTSKDIGYDTSRYPELTKEGHAALSDVVFINPLSPALDDSIKNDYMLGHIYPNELGDILIDVGFQMKDHDKDNSLSPDQKLTRYDPTTNLITFAVHLKEYGNLPY